MNREIMMNGKIKKAGDRVQITMPSSFAPHFNLMRWPEEIYAGRVTLYDHRIRFDDLPQTNIGSRS